MKQKKEDMYLGGDPTERKNTVRKSGGMTVMAASDLINGNKYAWATVMSLLCDYEGDLRAAAYNVVLAIVASDADGVRMYEKEVCQDEEGIFFMAQCMAIRRILGLEDVKFGNNKKDDKARP